MIQRESRNEPERIQNGFREDSGLIQNGFRKGTEYPDGIKAGFHGRFMRDVEAIQEWVMGYSEESERIRRGFWDYSGRVHRVFRDGSGGIQRGPRAASESARR